MRIGITGWRGFIGAHLLERLPLPGFYHTALPSEKGTEDNFIAMLSGDLTTLPVARRFVRRCDRIYHLAGMNRADDGHILANNLVSTGNLVLACWLENVQPEVIFASSTQTKTHRKTEYGLTKTTEESMIRKLDNWCIYRIPNVYGPGARPFYNSVVATFAWQVANGQEVEIENPQARRKFVYVDDLVEELLSPHFGGVVLPVGGEEMSIQRVYEYLTTRLGEHEKLKRCLDYYKGARE